MDHLFAFLDSIKDNIIILIISWFGGIAHKVYHLSKPNSTETFSWMALLANLFLAWFIGYIVAGFIDHDSKLYWPSLSMAWFCAYPLLAILEKQGSKYLSKFLK